MNIYFCHEWNSNGGLYIIARTRGIAKHLFSCETDISFIDVNCELYRKNIDEKNEGSLMVGDNRLKKYDLYYCDENGNEIQ